MVPICYDYILGLMLVIIVHMPFICHTQFWWHIQLIVLKVLKI